MPTLSIRSVPDALYERLKHSAQLHRCRTEIAGLSDFAKRLLEAFLISGTDDRNRLAVACQDQFSLLPQLPPDLGGFAAQITY